MFGLFGVQQSHQADRLSGTILQLCNSGHQLSLEHEMLCTAQQMFMITDTQSRICKARKVSPAFGIDAPHREARWLVAIAHSVMTLLAFQNLKTSDFIQGIPVHAFSKLLDS